MRIIHAIVLILVAILPTCAAAQTDEPDSYVRPVLSAYTIEAGTAHVANTYLTPLKYKGWQTALGYERMQAMRFDPQRWVMRLDGRLSLGCTHNPARTADIWSIDFNPSWSMMWRTGIAPGLTLAVGGNTGVTIGALYALRNGNNPVSVRAAFTVGLTGMAVWNGRISKLPVTLRYQPTLPMTGLFFMPDYDELYYEIWLGNHAGLCHAAWPGNYFRLDNLLTADLHFGATTLRLGYRCDIASTKANNIVARQINHSLVIGICSEWITLRAGASRTRSSKVISAMY